MGVTVPRAETAPAADLAASDERPGPRLLFVLNDAPFFVSHRLPIAKAAIREGYDVHVAVPHDTEATRIIQRAGCTVHELALDRRSRNPWQEVRLFVSLCRLYGRLRPAITHHVTVKPVLYGSLARRITGGGAVVNAMSGLGYLFLARGPVATVWRQMAKLMYRVALAGRRSTAVFQNPDDLALFTSSGLVARERAVLIRGSGVDLDEYAVEEEPEGSTLVLLPARMLWDKGVREFVGAARLLRQRGVAARCVLVGGLDVNRAAVGEDALRAWQDEGVVEWWGRRDDVPALMREAAIVCLPSYREGVPKALLEAAACGRAIVTTNVPGCREVVRDGENGLLVPVRDAVALADALELLLGDRDLRRRMGRAGRARAEQEFSVLVVVRKTLAIYAQALAAAPRIASLA